MEKENGFLAKVKPVFDKVRPVLRVIVLIWTKFWEIIDLIIDWIIRLRKIFLAVPVGLVAWYLAKQNMEKLPDLVGIFLQANGEYARMIPRDVAVYGPLAVTALCLLLMMFSRKTLYPWIISVFTLVLPFVVLITNAFPA